MPLNTIINEIQDTLTGIFTEIDTWFDKDPLLRSAVPPDGGWTIDQILEHISLTNHFLLIIIEKGTRKSLVNAAKTDLQAALQDYQFHRNQLDEVGMHRSFPWIRPAHMQPTGLPSSDAVRLLLKSQVAQCLGYLALLSNGAGALYKTTMSVNGLGKIDVYEYIYFLAQHARRHIGQMEGTLCHK
jgi:hypothetical protein